MGKARIVIVHTLPSEKVETYYIDIDIVNDSVLNPISLDGVYTNMHEEQDKKSVSYQIKSILNSLKIKDITKDDTFTVRKLKNTFTF